MCRQFGAELRVANLNFDGRVDLEHLSSLIDDQTSLVAINHISNVLGVENPIKDVAKICQQFNCKLLVDGAQYIAHHPVDVTDLGCDFYVFSGHKMYAGSGLGVLWAKQSHFDEFEPVVLGGVLLKG